MVSDCCALARNKRRTKQVSCDSHPFWTGTRRTLDTAGRVEKFYRRYGQR